MKIKKSACEMSVDRSTAFDKCIGAGKPFIEHFIKVCNEGKDSENFSHHCQEMQAFWNQVKNLTLKPRSKLISPLNLADWFFCLGSEPENIIRDDGILEKYFNFFPKLLADRDYEIKELLCTII